MHPGGIVHQGRRPEEEPVDDREHRGVGTNAERQRQYHGDGESRPIAQAAERIADVLSAPVEPADAPRIALRLAEALHAAERDACPPPCFVRRQSLGTHQLLGFHFEMEADLVVQFAVDGSAVEQRAEPPLELRSAIGHRNASVSWREVLARPRPQRGATPSARRQAACGQAP